MEMEVPTVQNTTADGELLKEKQYDIHVEKETRLDRKTGFFKQSKSYKMFPVFEKRWRIDDYGEVIDPYVFMNGEFQHAIAQQALLEEVCHIFNLSSRLASQRRKSRYHASTFRMMKRCI
jgi:hypothetical protein